MELNFSASNKSSSEDTKQTLFSVKTGDLKLRLNNPKNIFYADDVCAFEILPDYEKLIGIMKKYQPIIKSWTKSQSNLNKFYGVSGAVAQFQTYEFIKR